MFTVLSLPNIFALAIIVVFWARVFARARVVRNKVPAILFVFPVMFALIAYMLNRWHPWWGTIAVAAVHLFLAMRLFSGPGRGP